MRSIAPDPSDRDQRPEADGGALPRHLERVGRDQVYRPLNHHALAPPAFRKATESRVPFTPPSIPPVRWREPPRKPETPRADEVTVKVRWPGLFRAPSADPFGAEGRAKVRKPHRSPFPSGDAVLGAARSQEPFAARSGTRQAHSVPKGQSQAEAPRALAAFDRGLELIASKEYRRALVAWGEALALDPKNRTLQANLRRLERLLASADEPRLG